MVTRAPAVRARVIGRPEPPYDRLFDPLAHEIVSGGALARARFDTLWSNTAAIQALAEAKRGALSAALVGEMREYHQRLGASAASLANLERLGRGEAVCAVAGQQPAPLGGPLFALHKTAAAVGLARRIETRAGVPCVPLFWTHVDDSDFDEIRSTTIGDGALTLHDLVMPAGVHREGTPVGGIATAALAPIVEQAQALWQDLPRAHEALGLARAAIARGQDLGEAHSALVLGLFAGEGVVVIDPRLPAFRAAARPILDRYLEAAETLTAAARRAGAELENRIGKRPLADASLDSFVFGLEDGVRRKLTVEEARARAGTLMLIPNVALRPAVQDGVFPTVAMACGPGELAYLAQLREVFEGLRVRPACAVPRLGVTWLPSAAVTLLEASGAEPWEVAAATDAVVRRLAEQHVPAEVRDSLEQARAAANASLERFAKASTRVDPSLPQMVESARTKVDFQFGRLLEGVTGKARHRLEREHPEWLRVRYYLAPGDKLQERRLASLEPIAHRGIAAAAELCDLAEEHAEGLERGEQAHYLAEL